MIKLALALYAGALVLKSLFGLDGIIMVAMMGRRQP